MLEGKMVRVRFRRDIPKQPVWVFVGRVAKFTPEWIGIKGKGILVTKPQAVSAERKVWKGKGMVEDPNYSPVTIDAEARSLLFPRESIFNIRVLPDEFNLDDMRVAFNNNRLDLVVEGGPDSSIDEILED